MISTTTLISVASNISEGSTAIKAKKSAAPGKKAKPKPKARKLAVLSAEQIEALSALEQTRHVQLCQLLEVTQTRYCDDYLRQLATTAVQVQTVAEIVAIQAELLKQRSVVAEPASPFSFWGAPQGGKR